jgi:hypothetical protein
MSMPYLRQRAALAAIALAALPAFAAPTASNTPAGTRHTSQTGAASTSTSKNDDGWTETPKAAPAKPKASPELVALGQQIAQLLRESDALKKDSKDLTAQLADLKEQEAQVFDRLNWWDKMMSGGNSANGQEIARLRRKMKMLKNQIAEKNQLAKTRDNSATDRTGGYLERSSQLYRNYKKMEDGLRPVLRQTKEVDDALKSALEDLRYAQAAMSSSAALNQNSSGDSTVDTLTAVTRTQNNQQVTTAIDHARSAMQRVQSLNATYADFQRSNRVIASSNGVQNANLSPFTPFLSIPVLGAMEVTNAAGTIGEAIGTLQVTKAQVQAARKSIESENSGYVQRRTALINSTMKAAVQAAGDGE